MSPNNLLKFIYDFSKKYFPSIFCKSFTNNIREICKTFKIDCQQDIFFRNLEQFLKKFQHEIFKKIHLIFSKNVEWLFPYIRNNFSSESKSISLENNILHKFLQKISKSIQLYVNHLVELFEKFLQNFLKTFFRYASFLFHTTPFHFYMNSYLSIDTRILTSTVRTSSVSCTSSQI